MFPVLDKNDSLLLSENQISILCKFEGAQVFMASYQFGGDKLEYKINWFPENVERV